ncbi:MAG: glycogen synthase GlgA [Oceanicaulis sp.]|nr:glycogen synthase GlgA [Oceanicaulis sp.]
MAQTVSPPPRVLHIASELFPLVKTGGLADVLAALPPALIRGGADVRLLLPGYPAILAALRDGAAVLEDGDLFGSGAARLLAGRLDGVVAPAYLLDSPGLYDRPGGPYADAEGRDWPDNARRFAALGWAASRLAEGLDGWVPDILHGHDWQAGLAPAYIVHRLPQARRPVCIATIHNLAYQGWFPPESFGALGLPQEAFTLHGVEFYGGVGFLKAGLHYADRITTVSRSYAREIQTPEQGCGLDGLLRDRAERLTGIVNGIDNAVWNPARDPHLPKRYSARTAPSGKAAAKAALQDRLGLAVDAAAPLAVLISRLTWHKGIDLLLEALPALLQGGGQLAVLGSGAAEYEQALRRAATDHPGRVAAVIGYDEALAHLMQAGADLTLVPSRSEPCGLTQLYAQRYGALPLVRRTGGLADTVVNADPTAVAAGTATGFSFALAPPESLAGTLAWALEHYRDRRAWRAIQNTAMAADFGWDRAAVDYLSLYREAIR